MAGNKSFYVLKGFPVPRDELGRTSIHYCDVESLSTLGNEILSCAKQVLSYLNEGGFGHMAIIVSESPSKKRSGQNDLVYEILFLDIFLLLLRHKMPITFFFKVVVNVKYAGDVGGVIYEKQFDSAEMLLKIQDFTRPLFRTNGHILEEDATVDIIFGWDDSFPIKLSVEPFLQYLFLNSSSRDVVIVAGNGAELKCHRGIFEAHSEVLAAMLSPENGMREFWTGRVEMKHTSEEALEHLITLLYGVEVDVNKFSCKVAMELYEFAHMYHLEDLQDHLTKFFFQHESDWFEPDVWVELYCFVKNSNCSEVLMDHLEYMIMSDVSFSEEVRNCERFKELNGTELGSELIDLIHNSNQPCTSDDECL